MIESILGRLEPIPIAGCWVWTGACGRKGHGHVRIGRQVKLVHRVVYEHCIGPIPDGLCVLHRCDVGDCANPHHLFLGTVRDNNADRHRKGRSGAAKGAANGRAKLDAEKVAEIRRRYAAGEVTQKSLAEEYGVNPTAIGFIVRGAHWK